MFFLGHSLIIINWMKFLTAIKRFILHKNPIHNIRDRGFQTVSYTHLDVYKRQL